MANTMPNVGIDHDMMMEEDLQIQNLILAISATNLAATYTPETSQALQKQNNHNAQARKARKAHTRAINGNKASENPQPTQMDTGVSNGESSLANSSLNHPSPQETTGGISGAALLNLQRAHQKKVTEVPKTNAKTEEIKKTFFCKCGQKLATDKRIPEHINGNRHQRYMERTLRKEGRNKASRKMNARKVDKKQAKTKKVSVLVKVGRLTKQLEPKEKNSADIGELMGIMDGLKVEEDI